MKNLPKWIPFEERVKQIRQLLASQWNWSFTNRCKYISIKIDTRDGHAILLDRDGKAIELKDFPVINHALKVHETKQDEQEEASSILDYVERRFKQE